MPNGIRNWTFSDVVEFLKHHYFIQTENRGGSHRYFKGKVNGQIRLVEVQYHASKDIDKITLRDSIAAKSGIPIEYWIEWTTLGKKALKNFRYEGAENTLTI
jgi:predicted RNA binding protein YcfA (HicA-like mRNA interferase family)